MINPGGIPLIVADLDAVAGHGATLRAAGREFATTGADVHAGWQGLSAVYRAPEAHQLFTATMPVKATAAEVGADITAVGDALVGYADEVRPIQAQLARLRAEAGAFVSSVAADEDWRADGGKVDAHNALLSGVSTAVAAWMEAQRRCANAINARVGGTQYAADNGDARVEAHEYGYTTAQLDAAARTKEGGAWGRAEERDKPWWQDALSGYGSFLKGVWVDGAGGAVKGLWGFLNVTDGETFRQSWTALAKLSFAVNPLYLAMNHVTALPGLDKGELLSTLRDTGKGIVAWDTWDDDPARAAGATSFNIITTVVGTKGAGAGARGAGAAARAGSMTVREAAAGTRAALRQAPRSAGAWGRALPQRFAPGQLAVPGVGALPAGGFGGPTLGAAMAETRGAYAAGVARARAGGAHGGRGTGTPHSSRPATRRHEPSTRDGRGVDRAELNTPRPSSTYQANGYRYRTDGQGLVTRVDGVLRLGDGGRNGYRQRLAGGLDRLRGDHGGHLISRRFDGPREALNLIAQRGRVNLGSYRQIENRWADLLSRGVDVRVDIDVRYPPGSSRPSVLVVRWWEDGVEQLRTIRNPKAAP